MFRRKIYDRMLAWKHGTNGSRALLTEGPRRVGKTTIVESFARREYRSFIMIDFSWVLRSTHDLFNDIGDLNYLFLQLQLIYNRALFERESLIVFDEVQLCPKVRQAIKALVNDGRYDYIETVSRISIRKNTTDILIPSEERRIQMFPLDFEEFLWTQGDSATAPLLSGAFQNLASLGDATNRLLMRKFRLYMLVGGVPQAVDAYISTNSLREVDVTKRDILVLYEEDFYKNRPDGCRLAAIQLDTGRTLEEGIAISGFVSWRTDRRRTSVEN